MVEVTERVSLGADVPMSPRVLVIALDVDDTSAVGGDHDGAGRATAATDGSNLHGDQENERRQCTFPSPTRTRGLTRALSGSVQANGQPPDEVLLNETRSFVGVQKLKVCDARGERVPEGDQLHPCQCGSHSEMRSRPKRQMLAGVGAPDVQRVWLGKSRRISVGGTEEHHHPGSCPERPAAKSGLLDSRATQIVHGTNVAQRLLDRIGEQVA